MRRGHDNILRYFLLGLLGLIAFAQAGYAQKSPNWRFFKTSDGLSEPFCTTVMLDHHTNVWTGHPQSGLIDIFDGYSMQRIQAPDTGSFRVFETPGGQVWTCSEDGLDEYLAGKWIHYPIPEIRSVLETNISRYPRQVPIVPIKQNHVFFLLPDQLKELNAEASPKTTTIRYSRQTSIGKFNEMIAARDGGLWISGANGLAVVRGPIRSITQDMEWQEFVPDDKLSLHDFQQPVEDEDGGITVVGLEGPKGKKVVVYFDGAKWQSFDAPNGKIRLAWRGADKTFWALTVTGLFHKKEGEPQFVEEDEISVDRYFDAAVESGSVFWVATSAGLLRHTAPLWRTPPELSQLNARIHAIWEDRDDRIWLAGSQALYCVQQNNVRTFPYPNEPEKALLPPDQLLPLPLPGKLIMNNDGRLLEFDLKTEHFRSISHPSGARIKALGFLRNDKLCIAVYDNQNRPVQLQGFNGATFNAYRLLPAGRVTANDLLFAQVTSDGSLWIGGAGGVMVYRDQGWMVFGEGDAPSGPDAGYSFIEAGEGRLWCGGQDRLWEFDGKAWTGLRGGFERLNAIFRGTGGSAWIASNNGVHHLNKGNWVVNTLDDGLAGATVLTTFEDHKGQIWVGTTHGVSVYFPQADKEPPRTFVQKLDNEKNRLPDGAANFVFKGRDRWKTTPTERLLFSYRLDEFDWSAWTESDGAAFPELSSGKHYFQVRAMDRNANVDPAPALIEFAVTLPWYQETRLVLIALLGCLVALFFAVLAYNRHRKLVRSYAEIEKIVALRTQQLQKANEELLHSQKMTALGTLAAGIAHDFNNVLSIVKGSAQIIETNLEDREKIRTRVNRIKLVVEQGSGIVKAMLGFSRGSDKEFAPCDLNAAVEETIRLLGDRFLKGVDIQLQKTEGLPPVVVSKEFLQQILLNFIFNATESLPGPGKVTLRTAEYTNSPGNVALKPEAASRYVVVSVKDFGCGITAEVMPRIFEPFFTTKAFSARRGTGLGLSMVYQLAKEMGCGLMVESVVGQGSTFSLILPIRGESRQT